MKKRMMSGMIALAIGAAALAGCGSTGSAPAKTEGSAAAATAAATDNSDKTIKVVLKTLSSDYWQYVSKGCEQAGKDLGVNVDIIGATSETAYDEQLSMLETIISNNDGDALVVAPLQSDTVAGQIANTEMPVVAIDTQVDSDKVSSFVGFDNEEMGKLGATEAIKAAKEAGWEDPTAVAIVGVQGDPTSEARLKGFTEGVQEAGGTYLEGETQYADSVADKAVNCMEGLMQVHPEGIAVVFCNNDDMAMAAARAAKDNEAYKNTIFIGSGGTEAGLLSILKGEETMTVTFDGYDVGYKGVEAAVKLANGESVDSFIASEGSVVGADGAQDALDLVKERMK